MISKQTILKSIIAVVTVIILVYLLKYPINYPAKNPVRTVKEIPSEDRVKAKPLRYFFSIKVRYQGPQAIAFRQGKLVVAYKGMNIIDIYSPDGEYEGSFSAAPGIRVNPVAVSNDRSGGLYLCDMANRVVLFFDKENKFHYPFPPRKITPSGIDFIHAPGDVFVNKANVFVIDVGDSSVKVFTEAGEFLMFIRDWGKTGEKFLHPSAVMQCTDGRILVADTLRKKVAVFNCAGKFAYFFDDPKGETLEQPEAMTIDSGGNIHVLDTVKEKVFVYDNYGRYLFAYGSSGSRAYQMRMPVDIVADPNGKHIFIADTKNQQIDVWSY